MEEKNNCIDKHEDPEYWTLFIIDTETTGAANIPLWHPKNQVLQIVSHHVQSGRAFSELCDAGPHIYITPENTEVHRITQQDIEYAALPSETVFANFVEWVEDCAQGKTPLFWAHNARFDHWMVMKSLFIYLNKCYGRDSKNLNWYFIDSIACFKAYYPVLFKKYHAWMKPYGLSSLMAHFLPSFNMSEAHNAKKDVEALQLLVIRFLLPQMPSLFTSYWEDCPFFVNHRMGKESLRLILLKTMTGIKNYRTFHMNKKCNDAFLLAGGDSLEYQCSAGDFTIGHLLAYGKLRWEQYIKQCKAQHKDIKLCEYWFITREVEMLCRREPVRIFSDKVIVSILANVNGISDLDLTYHTMRSTGEKNYFPTCAGEPVSYLPFHFSEYCAERVFKELGFKTFNEIFASFYYTPQHFRIQWLNAFNARMEPKKGFTFQSLETLFKEALRYDN